MPVLVVDVDGYAFHANNPEQLKRDKMKDAILQKYVNPHTEDEDQRRR